MLKSIFKIGVYYSSKRNIFRITKGALGDALKEILCIPYALAEESTDKMDVTIDNKERK